jgi:hypothetical protein
MMGEVEDEDLSIAAALAASGYVGVGHISASEHPPTVRDKT